MTARFPTMKGLVSHCHERLYTLGVNKNRRRRIRIKEEKGRMTLKREFPLFEILKVYLVESSEFLCVFLLCFLLLL